MSCLEVGRRNNPGGVAEDLEPWARANQTVDPRCAQLALFQLRHRALAGHHGEALLFNPVSPVIPASPPTSRAGRGGAAGPRAVSQLTIVHVRDAGHSIHRDQFRAYLTAVKDFLR
jgi:hypothetical protein